MGKKDKKIALLGPVSQESSLPWLWIGTWSMGGVGFGPHDERQSVRVLERAISEGFTHFDTAPVYGKGLSESLLGRAVRHHRDRIFICTKGGLVYKGRMVIHDARPESLREQLSRSLERLKTEYVDLYMLHWPDPEVPIAESVDALVEIQKEGLTRFWGVCNLSAEQILNYLKGYRNIPHQLHFSALNRNKQILDISSTYCINLAFSVLERGLLSDSPVSEGLKALSRRDHRRKNPLFSDHRVLEWVSGLKRLSSERALPTSVVVLLWTACQSNIHGIITGPRKQSHMEELLIFRKLSEKITSTTPNSILCPEDVIETIGRKLWDYLDAGPQKVINN